MISGLIHVQPNSERMLPVELFGVLHTFAWNNRLMKCEVEFAKVEI